MKGWIQKGDAFIHTHALRINGHHVVESTTAGSTRSRWWHARAPDPRRFGSFLAGLMKSSDAKQLPSLDGPHRAGPTAASIWDCRGVVKWRTVDARYITIHLCRSARLGNWLVANHWTF